MYFKNRTPIDYVHIAQLPMVRNFIHCSILYCTKKLQKLQIYWSMHSGSFQILRAYIGALNEDK